MLKIIDDIPVDNTYCYNLKIAIVFCSSIKHIIRPRHEEQLNLVERWEKRLVWEV
jgi:hypothetical protein